MSAPIIQGWCPGALRPMLSGDGLVVRVRPRAGRLTSDQARAIARLARTHGNGHLDLSSRANLQLRGVTETSYPALIEGLRAHDLLDATPEAEARRNIVVQPYWTRGDWTTEMADAIALSLAEAPRLPGKFGFALDTGRVPVLRDTSADIRVERTATGELLVAADGMATGAPTSPEALAAVVLDLVRWFAGEVENGRGRMAALIASGARPPDRFLAAPRQEVSDRRPRPGLHPQGRLVGFAFGQLSGETLMRLSQFGPLRLTPWRMVLIEGYRGSPGLPEVIVRADDPLLDVIACTGAPGCLQALGPTRELARRLAPVAPGLHVSGCTKGCAHPGPARLTLVATAQGYDLVRHGRASDVPERTGLAPDDIASILDAP